MKSPLLLLGLFASLAGSAIAAPVAAKKPVAPPKIKVQPVLPLDLLAIPVYDSIPSEFSFTGTQKDLLGMVQSLGEGLAKGGNVPVSPNMNGAVRLFSDAELLDIVKDIHDLRVRSLSFRSRGDKAYEEALKAESPKTPAPAGSLNGANLLRGDDTYEREQLRLGQAQKFYADAFAKQGGKAQLTLQNDKTSVVVYVFSSPQSFALLTRGPSRVIVARADGLPRLGAIGRLVRQIAGQQ